MGEIIFMFVIIFYGLLFGGIILIVLPKGMDILSGSILIFSGIIYSTAIICNILKKYLDISNKDK